MSEDARRTYETQSKMITSKKTKEQLKEEKGVKTLGKPEPTTIPKLTKEETRKELYPLSKINGTITGTTTGPPKTNTPRRSALTPPAILYSDIIQGFYDRSNYPTKAEIIKTSEEKGSFATQYEFLPKTIEEATNRALYAVSETIGGGIRWATLGLSGNLGAENRDQRAPIFQTLGAFLTPSVQDMVANAIVGKALQTKKGRALLEKFYTLKGKIKGKLTMPEKLTQSQLDELEQLTKIDDPEFWKSEKGQKLFEELNRRVTHYIENPEAYTSGAAVIPEEVYIYQTLPPKVKPDIYEQFITQYGDKVDLSTKALLSLFVSGKIPKPNEILDDLADYNLDKPLSELSGSEIAELAKELDITGENLEEIISEIPEQIPEEIPEQVPIIIPDITQKLESEEIAETTAKKIAPVKLSKVEREEQRDLRLRLYNGPKEKYRVKFIFRGSKSQTLTVEARSFPEAVNRAQGARRGGEQQRITDVTRL